MLVDATALGNDPDLVAQRIKKRLSELHLIDFMDEFWGVLHPGRGPMVRGWALEGICEHLEAVARGEIKRLLITVPPGFSKSMATAVFFPVWLWGPLGRPHAQFLNAAYSDKLTQRDNERKMLLVESPEFQALWGHVFQPDSGTWGKTKIINSKRGFSDATSVKGQATGSRADFLICDDPHNVLTSESELVRSETLRWFAEVWSSRTNDRDAAFIVIMQRVHEMDVAAMCIELGYTHYNVAMYHEVDHPHLWVGNGHIAHEPVRKRVEAVEAAHPGILRKDAFRLFFRESDARQVASLPGYVGDGEQYQVSYAPQYGSGDPRTKDGELAFPEFFDEDRIAQLEQQMAQFDAQYAHAGQLQQRPVPRGGGKIQQEHIHLVDWDGVPVGGQEVLGWDLAGSVGSTSPFTEWCRQKYGSDGHLYVLEWGQARVESDDLDDYILSVMRKFSNQVLHSLPQDPAQAGKYQKKAMGAKFGGFWFKFSSEERDKESRANPVISEFGVDNVRIVKFQSSVTYGKGTIVCGYEKYVSNIKKFPSGRYKDTMDCTSRAHMELTNLRTSGNAHVVKQRVWRNSLESPFVD